jgi:quercetin dioxygenase-like cupin family protein
MPDLPPPGRHDLLEADLADAVLVDRVRITRIELAAGQATGRHRHPCPVIGCVLTGSIRLQVAGRPEQRLDAGDGFYEPADFEIAHFDNASEDQPTSFLACYLLSPGEDQLIEVLDPQR